MTTPGGGKRCAADIRFPRRLWNRPALPRIDYRIGTFADIRQRLFRELDLAPELAEWTHREADDPGIALLDKAGKLRSIHAVSAQGPAVVVMDSKGKPRATMAYANKTDAAGIELSDADGKTIWSAPSTAEK